MAKKHSNEYDYVLDRLKEEVASEMGIELGANQTSRNNGAVGGQMVQRLVAIAEDVLAQEKQ